MPQSPLVLDTNIIVASWWPDDRHHAAASELIRENVGRLVTNALVLAECAYLLTSTTGSSDAETRLLRLAVAGTIRIEPVLGKDLERMADLVERFADFPLGATDASVIAHTERLGATEIATVDLRHFPSAGPKGVTLLPAGVVCG